MRTTLWSAGLLVLVLCVSALAAAPTREGDTAASAPDKVVYDAASAFEFLKTLAGDWDRAGGGHDHGNSRVIKFHNSAAGSAVIETIYPGEPTEMVTVYHMDGDNLLLTHYCALQNAPVMKFEKTGKPGELKFAFHGGTNFDPQVNMHVHEGTMRIKDANTLESAFITFDDGKAGPGVSSTMKRKAKDAGHSAK